VGVEAARDQIGAIASYSLRGVMPDSIQIRPAQPDDAEVASALLYSAYTHTQLSYPLPDERAQSWIHHLLHHFRQDGNRFSYQCAHVATNGSQVVGLVLGFGGRDEARLNAAIGPWLEREAQDDEWYVDALAVFTDWGCRGIGTRLMRTAESQARQHRYPKIALNVAQGNTPALHLYTHLGYVVTQQTILYDRPHVRMVKVLDGEEPAIVQP
jgi:ribosomal protein S18 acetylase RimI-like enzyme